MKLDDCNNCNKKNTKIWRRYRKNAYCGTCYARVFKHSQCPKCKSIARLPKFDSKALCRKCENAKPCARCGKVDYKIGKISDYGPVCNSCSVYFRDVSACNLCGVKSNRLSKASHISGDLRVCIKCYNINKKTCPTCKRHRLLYPNSNGKLLCKKCLQIGTTTCYQCGFNMPAGYGKRCEECYWTNLLEKRIRLNIAGINSFEINKLFTQFAEWLLHRSGSNKAAITLNRYALFFFDIDKRFGKTPSYEDLINHFGPDGLRRIGLPIKFLIDSNFIIVDKRIKQEHSEQRRITSLLSKIKHTYETYQVIQSYYTHLSNKVSEGTSSTKSLRLALQPAVSLLLVTEKNNQKTPTQKILNKYLSNFPGQKCAITGFINFLKHEYQVSLLITQIDPKKAFREKRKKLERELLNLLRKNSLDKTNELKWIKYSIAFFHGIMIDIKSVSLNCKLVNDGYVVCKNSRCYWVPKPKLNSLSTHKNSIAKNLLDTIRVA